MSWVKHQLNAYILPGLCQSQSRILSELHMLCTASSHFVFDLCRRPFYGCARRLLFVHKETTSAFCKLTHAHLYTAIYKYTRNMGNLYRRQILTQYVGLTIHSHWLYSSRLPRFRMTNLLGRKIVGSRPNT